MVRLGSVAYGLESSLPCWCLAMFVEFECFAIQNIKGSQTVVVLADEARLATETCGFGGSIFPRLSVFHDFCRNVAGSALQDDLPSAVEFLGYVVRRPRLRRALRSVFFFWTES